jgi:hypothetical protein
MKTKLINALSYVLVFALGFLTFAGNASAAALVSPKVTLTSSIPAASTTYTVNFTPSAAAQQIKYVDMEICTTPGAYTSDGTGCTLPTGFAGTTTGSISGFQGTGSTFSWTAGTKQQRLTITSPAGENQVEKTVTLTSVTNPNAGTFYIRINTSTVTPTNLDQGVAAAAAISGVTVSGNQAGTFNVVVTGNTTQASANPACDVALAGDIDTTATATTVPYPDFENNTGSRIGSQRIEVDSNSPSGYTITGQSTQLMTAPSTDTIPGPTAVTWSEGSTYGFGVCSDGARTHTKQWDNPTTVRTLTSYNDTVDNDYTYVYFRVAVQSTQPAGTYSTTFNYIVTPVY